MGGPVARIPAASRIKAIADLLEAEDGVSIAAMAERYSVSMETIRRDLASLEKTGLLTRVHGGAIPTARAAPISMRVNSLSNQKASIGELAAKLVGRDGWIFMTHGSTTLSVAKALDEGSPMSVMTNMPAIAEALHGGVKHRVTLTGGEYDYADGALTGQQVLDAISECVFDTVIIAAYGIHPVHGLVESGKYLQYMKRLLFQRSHRRIVVADHSKFGAPGSYISAPLSEIGTIVTDEPPPRVFDEAFNEAGVRVIYPTTVKDYNNAQ
jgi:DeoR family glycerol-3-phosphate regulon repressor